MSRILRALSFVLVLSVFTIAADKPTAPALHPADNLVVEGVPDVPQSIVEQVGRYSEFRMAFPTSWHPVRREMIVGTRFGDTYQAHLVKMPGGARTQLTFFPENVYGGRFEPTKGDYFIYNKDKGGDEFYQIYRYELATGDSTLLTDGKSRNTGAVFSYKGDRIVYGSTRRTGNDVDLWVVEPLNPKSDHMLCELKGGGWQALNWSPDDKKILVLEEISANETYLWMVDSSNCEKKLLTPKGGKEKIAYYNAAISRDGKGVYVTTDKDSEFQRLAYIDLATGGYTFLTAGLPFDVDDFAQTWDGNTIAFVTNENGMSVLHLLDTRTRKELPAPKLPVGLVSDLRWHKNNRDLMFSMENGRSNSDAYSMDLKTGKVERWTYSETGGLNTANFSLPELIKWKSFDGMQITGFLYRPPTRFTGKRPVIVDIHGGPEGEYRPGFIGRDNYFLNELGVAMIFPNVRGSTGFGKTFLTLDNGFLRENSYKDIDALLDWIKQQPDLDADRIMITGGSYGGHMTLAISTFYSPKIRCSVEIVGMSNLATFLEHTSGYRQDLRRVEYGDERDPKMREFLERIAPLNNAEKIRKPMFVVQGYNDPRVPRTEAEQIVNTLKKTGTPVWYLMANDEGHGFQKKKNRDFEFYSTVLFMQEYLLK